MKGIVQFIRSFLPWLYYLALVIALQGCVFASRIENKARAPLAHHESDTPKRAYSVRNGIYSRFQQGDTTILLAFSGGGTRAAALSYGVMRALHETKNPENDDGSHLLDHVDIISSVSGGSFTAAYYGLFGERLFEDFEERFLRHDVQGALTQGLFSPLRLFSGIDRSDMAVNYYDTQLFDKKQFKDINLAERPLILINATDLGYGVRFSFVDEYFSLVCSDINEFSIARAVAASSAVPILFSPIVLRNHDGCDHKFPDWMKPDERDLQRDLELKFAQFGLSSYRNHNQKTYVHLVDGGITDNLGLRAYIDLLVYSGGGLNILKKNNAVIPKRVALIVVNADSRPKLKMDLHSEPPALAETVSSMTGLQLRRYNAATVNKMRRLMDQWGRNGGQNPEGIDVYLIEVNLSDIQDKAILNSLNAIPTRFSLPDEQVDLLIQAGMDLLHQNHAFNWFMDDLTRSSKNTR